MISLAEKKFTTYVVELMQLIGPVRTKKMFGGYGIFLDGLMFAVIFGNILYLKVDKETKNEFIEKGLEAFSYKRGDKVIKLSYFEAPEEVFEDDDEMSFWANRAYSSALKLRVNLK